MAKTKVPKFNTLRELKAWSRAQKRNSFDRKERKVERKRIKKLGG